jgi:voltage-gated potassium channel
VLVLGTAGYALLEGWSLEDAFYMTVITVTTVGYSEVRELDSEGRLFTSVLLLVGVGVAFYILTSLVAAIIEGDLEQIFGERRLRMAVERTRNHYIVCGYGRVGEEIVRELRDRKVPVVIVDLDVGHLEAARNNGTLIVQGDATEESTLTRAGIERCRGLIAASDSDSTNTFITLTAKGLRPDVFVVARVSTPEMESKLRQAGASRVVSPYAIGGRRLALAALQPIITDFIDLFPAEPEADRIIAELAIDNESGLAGKDIEEALTGCRDVVVLALRKAEGRLSVGPPRSTRLELGDTLVIIGEEDDLRGIGAVARR